MTNDNIRIQVARQILMRCKRMLRKMASPQTITTLDRRERVLLIEAIDELLLQL